MEVSVTVARAMEQVKVGLGILYGANYFTEDEWNKIHGVIRNKQYGSMPRPPSHILDDEEPLISFPDSKEDADVIQKHDWILPSKNFKKDTIVISETEIQSFPMPEPLGPTQFSAGDSSSQPATTHLDSADTHSDVSMAVGQHTQAQLSETSFGHESNQMEKSLRDYVPAQSHGEIRDELGSTNTFVNNHSNRSLAPNGGGGTLSPDLANISERELWNHSSATDVDSDEITSPTNYQEGNQQYSNLPAASDIGANDKFNSIEYSNNTRYTRTTKSLADSLYAHDTSSGEDGSPPLLEVTPGTILIAQTSFPKTTKVHVDICSGDSIRVMKKVSGIMYHGENLRTNQTGQFPSSIFQRSARERKKVSALEMQRAVAMSKASMRDMSLSSSSHGKDLDKVEDLNAAEWGGDDASVITAPMAINSATRELAGGKYSGFADLGSQVHPSESTQQEVMAAMMNKMLNEKLHSIQTTGRNVGGSSGASSIRSKSRNTWNEPLEPVVPKTHICWFYATPNKECRFTAEECRDLHVLSAPGLTFALHNGKPTWGAAADYMPESDVSMPDSKRGGKTCWYWANAKCEYTADSCRFLHKHVPAGVMPKPGRDKSHYWRKGGKDIFGSADEAESSIDGWGDASIDLMDQSAWGETSTEKYKPPHIKALEEKEQMRSAGW